MIKCHISRLMGERKLKIADVEVIETEKTALNNNILSNDKIAFISPEYTDDEAKEIGKKLGLKAVKLGLAETNVPGSCGMINSNGAIFNPNLSDKEIARLEKALGFEIGMGTINRGSSFIGSGLIANSNGFIVGKLSSGYEIGRVDESLGFLD